MINFHIQTLLNLAKSVLLLIYLNIVIRVKWIFNVQITWTQFKHIKKPLPVEGGNIDKVFKHIQDKHPSPIYNAFKLKASQNLVTSKYSKECKKLKRDLSNLRKDIGKEGDSRYEALFSSILMLGWNLKKEKFNFRVVPNLIKALHLYLITPRIRTFFIFGNPGTLEAGFKACLCLILAARVLDESPKYKKLKLFLYWVGYNIWSCRTREAIKISFDWTDYRCSPTWDKKHLVKVEKPLTVLALAEKDILGKTSLLEPLQRLPQFLILVSPYKFYLNDSKELPKYLLGALTRVNGFVGGDNALKTLGREPRNVIWLFNKIFGEPEQEGFKVPLYKSPGTDRFLVFPKANKVVYKWTNKDSNGGGVIIITGNPGLLHNFPGGDLAPHHFSLWIWKEDPSKGKWLAKDIQINSVQLDIPYKNCEERSTFLNYDPVWCHVTDEGIIIRFKTGGFVEVTDTCISIYSKLKSNFWIHGDQKTLCFNTFKTIYYD